MTKNILIISATSRNNLELSNKIHDITKSINSNCELINIKLNDLTKKYPNLDANIIGIIRDEKFIIPKKKLVRL